MASTLVLVIVFIFDLIAFALAIAAEQRRSTAKIVQDGGAQEYSHCVYDSDIATGLGVGALFFLAISQVIIMIASKCFCCGRGLRPGGARAWAIILFITCWMTFFIGEVCLLAGSVRNAYHTKYKGIIGGNDYSCETLRKGVFGAGAAFIFFTAIVSEFYYVCYGKANTGGFQPSYGKESGVGMSTY
ncbi:uncharacterized protein LOC143859268 [Tasmannia lanceolata]|uniref:uncharacterized protein LOC143859268 n=1 Tax=Tasmannia lanceolata TaxID=3420 RepID=UPI0040647620